MESPNFRYRNWQYSTCLLDSHPESSDALYQLQQNRLWQIVLKPSMFSQTCIPEVLQTVKTKTEYLIKQIKKQQFFAPYNVLINKHLAYRTTAHN